MSTIDPLFDMLFESMVIHLYKLFELHPILSKCLKESNQLDLLRILKNGWCTILKTKPKVNIWRNRIISHSGEQSVNYKHFDILDPQYNETRNLIVTTSRYAVIYIWAILGNIHSDYMNATLSKEQHKNSLIRVDGMEILTKAIHDEKIFWKEVNSVLNKGYRPVSWCGYEEWPMKLVDI